MKQFQVGHSEELGFFVYDHEQSKATGIPPIGCLAEGFYPTKEEAKKCCKNINEAWS